MSGVTPFNFAIGNVMTDFNLDFGQLGEATHLEQFGLEAEGEVV